MLLADRSRATWTIAVCAVAAALSIAVPRALRHRGHHRHHAASHVLFAHHGCREWIPPPTPVALPPVAPVSHDRYARVLEHAASQLDVCFARDPAPVGVLLTIAPDGHVRAASTRPDPETAHARCVEGVAAKLVFPPSGHTMMLRTELPIR